jgi:hypothetical protein
VRSGKQKNGNRYKKYALEDSEEWKNFMLRCPTLVEMSMDSDVN